MSEEKNTGSSIGKSFEQYRDRVMQSDAVKTVQERFQAQGPEVVERVKGLATEAGVRRISIQQDGRTIFEFPLAVGVVGALIAPQLAALGALAALVTNCTIAVEREESAGSAGGQGSQASGSSKSGGSGTGSSGTSGGQGSGASPGSSGSSTATGGAGGTDSTGPGGATHGGSGNS